jgi:hypothetical protein
VALSGVPGSRRRAAARAEARQEAVHQGLQAHQDPRARPDPAGRLDRPDHRRDRLDRRACPVGAVAQVACRAAAVIPVAAHSGVEEL